MAKTKTFSGVTPAKWECLKTTSFQEHGTIYTPPTALRGTATTNTPVGEVILNYDYNAANNDVTYTIEKKPFIVGEGTIWNGIQTSLDGCSNS